MRRKAPPGKNRSSSAVAPSPRGNWANYWLRSGRPPTNGRPVPILFPPIPTGILHHRRPPAFSRSNRCSSAAFNNLASSFFSNRCSSAAFNKPLFVRLQQPRLVQTVVRPPPSTNRCSSAAFNINLVVRPPPSTTSPLRSARLQPPCLSFMISYPQSGIFVGFRTIGVLGARSG